MRALFLASVLFAFSFPVNLVAETPPPLGPPPGFSPESGAATDIEGETALPLASGTGETRDGNESDPGDNLAVPARDYQLEGLASWYGGKFQGRLTANGEIFDTNQLTAAHRELPFGTIVKVTNTTNSRLVVVRINDRGPFVDNRVIDLSRAAADIIGLTAAGVAPVKLEIIHYQPVNTRRVVQVASFGALPNADALVTQLSDAGLAPVIETAPDSGVHRVVIPDVERDEVPAVQDRLAALGYLNVLIREAP